MRRKHNFFLIILICVCVAALYFFGAGENSEPDYSSFSTGSDGASLLYDTLHRIDYPVSQSYEPVDTRADINDVCIVIMPEDTSYEDLDEMLAWARKGGRLIYLGALGPSYFDDHLSSTKTAGMGHLTLYQAGLGEVITGLADDIVNERLMEDDTYGQLLANALRSWNADSIRFVEYYHGYRASDNFFTQLPSGVKLCVYQLIILMAVYVWYRGKRFGKAIPYYEETERAGDEYVRALAHLYYKTSNRMSK